MQHIAFIGLGSNLDLPSEQLLRAFIDLDKLPSTRLLKRSSLYQSAPIGYLNQPNFVNAVAQISTTLTPQALLKSLLQVEHSHGRERTFQNAPRTLDLELHEHGLTIPHPQMHLRAFVLQPLLEIAPDCTIPAVGLVIYALQACQDQALERLVDVL
jgi:2-amino-4-hydroxy-6-hydroxymethyldihydropteridine diphosphokinase